jgi:uncharacterized SAM-binding protein YcdF (DUF218 family)
MGLTAAFGMVLKALVLPPACLLALYGAGWLLRRRRPRLASACRHGAVLLLYVLSTGVGSWLLAHPLEMLEPVLAAHPGPGTPAPAQAIVVLTAGRIRHSPEYGRRAMPDYIALERITYGAHVARATGLPLLVSGGLLADDDSEALALGMKRVFEDEFRLPVRWSEAQSRNTAQNATLSAAMLGHEGVTRIILVTDAMHMRRARLAFERAGLAVTPAPTFYVESSPFDPSRLMPTVENLRRSHYALYEWFGLAWYWLAAPR